MTKARVLIIERQAEMMVKLLAFFEARPDMEVAEANQNVKAFMQATHLEARALMDAIRPDAVIVDFPGGTRSEHIWLSRLREMTYAPLIAFSDCPPPVGLRFFDVIARPAADEDCLPAFRKLVFAVRRAMKAEKDAAPKAPPVKAASAPGIIAIGASAGGTQAIADILASLPGDMPPILIVQHITRGFSEVFARHLNNISALSVSMARDGEEALPGRAYVAPDDMHMRLLSVNNGRAVSCKPGKRISGHMPSVDALFKSVADVSGESATGVLLTGMGRDGAQGLLRMRQAGAHTVCQDEATSFIYGMPRAAMDLGAATIQLPLKMIAGEITRRARGGV